ncbi:YcjF family protein [Synechocystis sp. PCC 6714]|uniref:YcjF family protein n=2 Tax=unclassified Synechocystis TaxID=2640012 RepID=UPI000491B4CA|nr:GTPase [Synechocystis sp. PCC 6714]MCT0253333.1 50S ribosome-binding GTPase [Synechocystis sp. CS-94]
MENFDLNSVVTEAIKEALKERGHVNILIAGRTGVGKSTLINSVFQGNFATTGQGRPVTQHTREIKKEGVPLSIFDTRGLEMADFSETLEELRQFVINKSNSSDSKEHIHVAWICIAEDLRRVEPAEEELVKLFSSYMSVIVVITKARQDKVHDSDGQVKSFHQIVQSQLPLAKNVIRVRAIQEELDEGHILPPIGLHDLVKLTMEVVPEGTQRAFVAAQKVDLELKRRKSRKIVLAAAAAAGSVGVSPIPFSDAVAIVPIQVGMLAVISATFGLTLDQSFLVTIVGAFAAGVGGTFVGRAIVSNILKMIPGVGSIAGGAISATTAATITTTLGEIYINVLYSLFANNNGEPPSQEEISVAIKKQLALP